jgi:myo-inositol-1(or 4)-monophosphatase
MAKGVKRLPSQSPELQFAVRTAKAAGKILMDGFGTQMTVRHKSNVTDLVTEYDHRSEEYILGKIRRAFPGHRILSEESGLSRAGSEPLWLVDPLDGTTNFAHGLPIFAVSIALRADGLTQLGVVYNPTRGECFWAERGKGAYLGRTRLHVSERADLDDSLLVTGFPYDARSNRDNNLEYFSRFAIRTQGVRRLGSAAIDLAYIAAGRFDGYWELRLGPWDVAAGGVIAEEAGARVTAMDGKSNYLSDSPSLIAANPVLHAKMVAVLQDTG